MAACCWSLIAFTPLSVSMSAPGEQVQCEHAGEHINKHVCTRERPKQCVQRVGGAGATRLEAARGGKPWLHASALCSLGSFGTSSRRQVDNGSAPNGARRLLQLRRMPP